MSRSKTIKPICKYCGQHVKRRPNIYCSNKCQRRFQLLERYKSNPGELKSSALRSYLKITRGLKCEICLLESWQNKPIPLEVDHVSGNWQDNSEENIRFLCPNCHAQTPTWKNKNKGNGRKYRLL